MISSGFSLVTPKKRQKGAATLLTAVVLLIVVLGISFYTSETVITEKKVVANDYRAKQAFHAAQSGLDFGIAYAREGVDQDSDSALDLSASAATGSVGNASYSVTLTDISAGSDMSVLRVDSTGFSDDGLISRTLSVLIGETAGLPNPPNLPVTAKSNINTLGNLQVYNQFENFNVWTGENLTSWGSSDTWVRDPDWSGFAGDTWDGTPDDLSRHLDATGNSVTDIPAIQSTTKNTRGPDVIDGDANLETLTNSEFIENFFGTDLAGVVDKADQSFTSAEFNALSPTELSNLNGIIHLNDEGSGLFQISGSGDIGTEANPVILVVNGDIRITGNREIRGLVVAETFKAANGTVDVIGGVLAADEIEKMNGTFSVFYSPGVMGALEDIKNMEVIRGSWKDW